MAIIYTYPLASTPVDANDLVIITDVSDNNKSKNTTIQSIIDLAGTGGGTGLDGEFAFFDGNGTTIKGSDLLTTSNNKVFIKDYISHKDNSTGDTAFFGFNNDNEFLVYLGTNASERLELKPDTFVVKTDSGNKISAGPDFVSLFVDDGVNPATVALSTQQYGIFVKGFGANSGSVRYYAGDNNSYVGIQASPTTAAQPENYILTLPNTAPAASGKVLATSNAVNPYQLEWITPSSGGSNLAIEDENNVVADAATTINFTGGGVTASGDNTQVDVEVLPRLNHGFSPFPISQGSDTIQIQGGDSLAIAAQAICDIAAGQLTITRIFGKLPADCVINVAVYTGSLTFQGGTSLAYFGSTTVSGNAGSPNSNINNIFFVDVPVGTKNNWVPIAGTPIIVIIEIDNSANANDDAYILGTQTAASKPSIFQENLSFEVTPPQNQTSIFNNTNTVLGQQVNTILNFGSAAATNKRVCQHFDPDI